MNTATLLSEPVRVLVAEDEPEIRDYLQLALDRPNFVIEFAEDGEEALLALRKNRPAVRYSGYSDAAERWHDYA